MSRGDGDCAALTGRKLVIWWSTLEEICRGLRRVPGSHCVPILWKVGWSSWFSNSVSLKTGV